MTSHFHFSLTWVFTGLSYTAVLRVNEQTRPPLCLSCCTLVEFMQSYSFHVGVWCFNSVCMFVTTSNCVVSFPLKYTSVLLCVFVCVPSIIHVHCIHLYVFHRSCCTLLMSLRHVFCVFSLCCFHPYMSTSICPEAVSSTVWQRNETGMGVWIGSYYKPGSENCFLWVLFVFIAFQLDIQYCI